MYVSPMPFDLYALSKAYILLVFSVCPQGGCLCYYSMWHQCKGSIALFTNNVMIAFKFTSFTLQTGAMSRFGLMCRESYKMCQMFNTHQVKATRSYAVHVHEQPTQLLWFTHVRSVWWKLVTIVNINNHLRSTFPVKARLFLHLLR